MDLQESKGAQRLFFKVNSMLDNMDKVVAGLEEKEKVLAERIEAVEDKSEVKDQQEEIVTIHELIEAVNKLQKTPDSARIEHIARVLEAMDEDADGIVKVDHVLKVVRLLGRENVNLTAKQINDISEMLEKEEMLEVEDDIKKVLIQTPLDESESESETMMLNDNSKALRMEEADESKAKNESDDMFEGEAPRARMSCDHDQKNGGKTDLK